MKRLLSVDTFQEMKNRTILTHWQSGLELLRVLEGSMHCLINGKEFVIGKDDLCMINQNQLHRIYCDENNYGVRFQCLMLDPSLLSNDKEIVEHFIEPLLSDSTFTHMIVSAKDPLAREIIGLMDAIEELETNQPPAYELLLIAFLHMIFQKLYMHYELPKSKKVVSIDADVLLYRKLAEYIYKNYERKLSLEEIALYGNVSRNKCCAVFKKFAQHSPIDFLNLYRLQVSTERLKNTQESIAEIAFHCGFGQQSYYNRLFLRRYGMTPKEYRKQCLDE